MNRNATLNTCMPWPHSPPLITWPRLSLFKLNKKQENKASQLSAHRTWKERAGSGSEGKQRTFLKVSELKLKSLPSFQSSKMPRHLHLRLAFLSSNNILIFRFNFHSQTCFRDCHSAADKPPSSKLLFQMIAKRNRNKRTSPLPASSAGSYSTPKSPRKSDDNTYPHKWILKGRLSLQMLPESGHIGFRKSVLPVVRKVVQPKFPSNPLALYFPLFAHLLFCPIFLFVFKAEIPIDIHELFYNPFNHGNPPKLPVTTGYWLCI